GSDGFYSLTIPKQSVGTVIKAVVSKDGLTSEATTTVTRGELAETTILAIDTTTTSVSGKAEPNAKIELKNGNTVIATGTVGSDGFYSLTIPKQSVGAVIKAVVSKDGLTSEATTTVIRGELAETTISAIDTTTTSVSGKAEPNAKIELKNGNTVIATGTVGSDGKYSLTISKQPTGSAIIAVVTLDGKTSQASTVVTRAELAETIISAIDTTTTSVSGKAEPNAKIELKNGNT
ncbi:autolysin modifier protein, partial [Enterococcus faecalis]|nr:autolysin modifier protein [Enterococcus faecalis]